MPIERPAPRSDRLDRSRDSQIGLETGQTRSENAQSQLGVVF